MKTGFIGLGIMGSRMAANLAKEGHSLVVYNRTRERARPVLQHEQVEWRDSPVEVAREADLIFTMLSTPEAVRGVALGKSGFLDYMQENAIWVDSSTVNPAFSREMAEESNKRHLAFVDAPVAGSKDPAENGELLFLVGGDKPVVDQLAASFQAMGKKYIHVGKHGMGTSLKMVFNLLLGQAMFAFSEGMNLGESLGIDQQKLFEVLLQSPVVAPFVSGKRARLENADYEAEFPLQWMQKDLQLASQTAYETGLPLPAVNVIKEVYNMAKQAGYAEKDFSSIYQFLKSREK